MTISDMIRILWIDALLVGQDSAPDRTATMKQRYPQCALTSETALWIWARALLCLMLLGYAVFAHGCHGDEDHELFDASRPLISPSGIMP